MPKTAAEQQIEMLRQMKEGRRGPSMGSGAADGGRAGRAGAAAGPRVKPAHSLPVGRETWRRLLERRRSTREFRGKKDMGEWAAQLLLALPPEASSLDAGAREELFRRMREWCAERGLS